MSQPAGRGGRAAQSSHGLEHRLVVTARRRGAGRLDDITVQPRPADPPLGEVARWGDDAPDEATLWLTGGEPTLRSDLPALLAATDPAKRGAGLCTDGLALVRSSALDPLRAAGLARVRITLHAARADAHDWLVHQPGAARRVIQAIRRCRADGLDVELAAVVTRPTMPHLGELCELAAHLGASAVHLRRLLARGPAANELVMLSARMALLGPHLEEAASVAQQTGLRLALHGFARCVAPGLDRFRVPSERIRWQVSDGMDWRPFREQLEPTTDGHHCPSCPGQPDCEGIGADYVERFGWTELHSEDGSDDDAYRPAEPTRGVDGLPPRGRAGRAPATRPHRVARQTGVALSGDPLAPRAPRFETPILRIRFGGPSLVSCATCGDRGSGEGRERPETTRLIRRRLVRVAQEGATVLRIASAGSLAHPDAARLLAETALLGFERIEVAAEGSALAAWTDEQLAALNFVHRLDVALYGPDAARHDAHVGIRGAFEATLQGLKRLTDHSGVEAGVFAVLHDEQGLGPYARQWSEGRLPGAPAFRLSPSGSSLRQLAAAARTVGDEPTRSALARLLPACLLARPSRLPPLEPPGWAFVETVQPAEPPSGSDRLGQFRPCECDTAELRERCPGVALGWSVDLSDPESSACRPDASTARRTS